MEEEVCLLPEKPQFVGKVSKGTTLVLLSHEIETHDEIRMSLFQRAKRFDVIGERGQRHVPLWRVDPFYASEIRMILDEAIEKIGLA